MKHIFKTTFAAFASLTLLTGCIEESIPYGDALLVDQVNQNVEGNAMKLNGLFADMMTSVGDYNHCDCGLPGIFMHTENMLEDLVVYGNIGYNQCINYMANAFQDADGGWSGIFWNYYYPWIKSTNEIIGSINPEEATEVDLKVLGQAKAMRAYFYLDLARLYEPKPTGVADYDSELTDVLGLTVPLVTEATTEEMSRNNPRLPRKDMYDFILAELKEASTYLEGVRGGFSSPGIDLVNGLYARTYIELGAGYRDAKDAENAKKAYTKAVEYADKVINESGKSPLTQIQWEDPTTGFNDGGANNAWVFGLKTSQPNLNNIVTFTSHMSGENQWGYASLAQFGVNMMLYNAIPDTDFRKHSWLDPKLDEYYEYKFAGTPDQVKYFKSEDGHCPYQIIKFRPHNGNVADFTVGNLVDIPLMRIEEMDFIKAEAQARLGQLAEAKTTLETLIKTRDAEYQCTADDEDTFIDEMFFNKRVEFFGEGILIYDYKRLDKGINRGEGTGHQPPYSDVNFLKRSPQWNITITRSEYQENKAIPKELCNPDPSTVK